MSKGDRQKIIKNNEIPRKVRIHSRVILEQAKTTIQDLIDAAVELITNSDDSYKQLEREKIKHDGEITIYVKRAKGGMCKEFWVRDFAEGMSKEKLKQAIEYGAKTSAFHKGRSARGLFGRGLKEAILSLGEGEIYTARDGALNIARLWWDEKKEEALYRLISNLNSPNLKYVDEDVEEFVKRGRNGTFIKIEVKNEKMVIPEYDKFKFQLANHYALRDINSSKNREIILIFEDERRRTKFKSKIEFIWPEGKLREENRIITLPKYNDQVRVNIWESSLPLSSQPIRYDPYAKAGILIKTEDTILDNQLFKFDSDPAAFYFWGEAICNGIAERVRKGEKGIIDPNRGGIKWKHDYCKYIKEEIEKILEPLIREKKQSLELGEKKPISRKTKEMLKDVSKLLDKWAKKEFKEWKGPEELPELRVDSLIIIPNKANIEVDEPRTLSIYAPRELIEKAGTKVIITSDCSDIKIVSPGTKRLTMYLELPLKPHPKDINIYYNFFKIRGRELGKQAYISCNLGNQEATTLVVVKQPTIKKRKKKGGFISDIKPDNTLNPIQRTEYDESEGIIKIYIKFPGVARYFPSGLDEIEKKEESRIMLAELIGEAFCRTLARRQIIETGGIPGSREAQIDDFNNKLNNMQKKYLDKIHEIILNWKF
jgi:hypothetical protein